MKTWQIVTISVVVTALVLLLIGYAQLAKAKKAATTDNGNEYQVGDLNLDGIVDGKDV